MKNFIVADRGEGGMKEPGKLSSRLDLFPFGTAVTPVHVTSMAMNWSQGATHYAGIGI